MLWLSLYVNLSGLRDSRLADKMLFLDVSVKKFLEEISISISKLSERDHSHQCVYGGQGGHLILKGLNRTKSEELQILSSLELDIPLLLPSDTGPWPLGSGWIIPLAPLQTVCWPQDFSASVTLYANSCNKSPSISVYI